MQTQYDAIVRSAAISKAKDGAIAIMMESTIFDPDLVTKVSIELGNLKVEQLGHILAEVPIPAKQEADIRSTHEIRVINVAEFGRIDETATITEPLELH